MKLTNKIRNQAEKTIELTMDEAGKLPGLLGKIVPPYFENYGFYSAVVDGKKTLYIKKEDRKLDIYDKVKLAKDAAFDRPPSITGKEAQEYYDKVKAEIAENKTQGFGFDIPWDWADD